MSKGKGLYRRRVASLRKMSMCFSKIPRGGFFQSFLRGCSAPSFNPLPILTEKIPLSYTFNWFAFIIGTYCEWIAKYGNMFLWGAGMAQWWERSHQYCPGSIPGPGVIYGLLVLFSAPRGLSPGTPVFPSSHSIWIPILAWKVSTISARALNTLTLK